MRLEVRKNHFDHFVIKIVGNLIYFDHFKMISLISFFQYRDSVYI